MGLAASKNDTPLPTVKPHCGIRLPPDRYCLSACNYKLKSIKKTNPKSSVTSSTSSPRITSVIGSNRAIVRPNSPAVRAQGPRPVVKVTSGPTPGPKFQIGTPLPTPTIKQEPEESRGVKRERDDDDYDAA